MSEPAKLPAPGELFAERYQIECALGGGFESQVLGASDRETGRRVAIKCWTGEHAEQAVGSVRAYMRAAYESGLYEHPNLVEVFAAELQDGVGYCVREWLEGTTLARELARVRPSTLETVFEHVLPCMRAVAEAHAAGIVHGDLRPGHIFLCRATRHRPARPRVFDFGRGMPGFQELRAHKRPSLDEACHYTMPEQLQSAPLDARSDQYAFGVMLYEMLAGVLPFSADNGNDLALEIVAGFARPLSEIRASLPEGLSDVVARAMATDPAERFADLSGLIEALEAFNPRYAAAAPAAPEHSDYHVRVPQTHAAESFDAYDWSFQDSSEPRPVMIPAAAPPQRSHMFLPRAALAGAITAAVISAVYLDEDLFDRLSFDRSSETRSAPRSGATRGSGQTATSYSGIEHADGKLPALVPMAAPGTLAPLPPSAAGPLVRPVAVPPLVAAPQPAPAVSHSAPQLTKPAPQEDPSYPPLEVPQRRAASVARPEPERERDEAAQRDEVAPVIKLPERSLRRRKANPQEAIDRLDTKLLLQ